MTPAQLAARWCTDVRTLANQRAQRKGLRFEKDPDSGRISYLLADVLEAERKGMHGVTPERLDEALRAQLGLSPKRHASLMRKLQKVLG